MSKDMHLIRYHFKQKKNGKISLFDVFIAGVWYHIIIINDDGKCKLGEITSDGDTHPADLILSLTVRFEPYIS